MSSFRKSGIKWPRGWRAYPWISSRNSALLPKGVVVQIHVLHASSFAIPHLVPKALIPLSARYGCLSPKICSFFFPWINIFHEILVWHLADQLKCILISLPCSYLCHVIMFWSTQWGRKWYLQITGHAFHVTPLPTVQNVAMMTRTLL